MSVTFCCLVDMASHAPNASICRTRAQRRGGQPQGWMLQPPRLPSVKDLLARAPGVLRDKVWCHMGGRDIGQERIVGNLL